MGFLLIKRLEICNCILFGWWERGGKGKKIIHGSMLGCLETSPCYWKWVIFKNNNFSALNTCESIFENLISQITLVWSYLYFISCILSITLHISIYGSNKYNVVSHFDKYMISVVTKEKKLLLFYWFFSCLIIIVIWYWVKFSLTL